MEGFKPYHKTMTDFLKVIPETHQDESNQGTPKQATLNKQVNTVSQPLLQADGIHSIPGSFTKKKLDLDLTKETQELMQFMDEIEQEKAVEKMSPMDENALFETTTTDTSSQTDSLPSEQTHEIHQQLLKELVSTRQALETSQLAEYTLQDKVFKQHLAIEQQKQKNHTLSDKNRTLCFSVQDLTAQLKAQKTTFTSSIELARSKALETLTEANEVQKQSEQLSETNEALRKENASLRQKIAMLSQELTDAASATDDDTRSSLSASTEDLATPEEYAYEPTEQSPTPEQDSTTSTVYETTLNDIAYNIKEFQGSTGQDIDNLLRTLTRLIQNAQIK